MQDHLRKKVKVKGDSNLLAEVLDGSPDGVMVLDREWTIIYMNRRAAATVGFQPKDLISQNLWEKFPQILGTPYEAYYRKAMEEQKTEHFESWGVLTDQQYDITIYPSSARIVIHWQDVTERKLAEEDLAKSKVEMEEKVKERTWELAQVNKELKLYSQRITKVQEEERARIARELHDDTIQHLALLSLELDSMLHNPDIQSAKVLAKLKQLKADTDRAMNDVRRYSHELKPSILEHVGLEAALKQLVTETMDKTHLKIEFTFNGDECPSNDEEKLALFRIAQEALSNIRKHAQASKVIISLECLPEKINLAVMDNGRGFNVEEQNRAALERSSMGLLSMRDRTRLIGANLKIESALGKGTTVMVEMPLGAN